MACGGYQRDWRDRDWKENQHMRWKMAQYHFAIRPHTRKKREQHDQWQHWASLFHRYKVKLVVESDAHCVKTTYPVRPTRESGSDEGFIRDDMTGTVYVGEGCWGAPLRSNDDNKNWTRNSGSFNQFKWIFVDEDKIEVRTVKTDNADYVGRVDPYNVFFPPNGLSIWQPSNGPVIYLRHESPRTKDLYADNNDYVPTATTSARPLLVSSNELAIQKFKAVAEQATVVLTWTTQNEPSEKLLFEVQRSLDGKTFRTIAHLPAQGKGQTNHYRLIDYGTGNFDKTTIQYRLLHNFVGDQGRYQPPKTIATGKEALSGASLSPDAYGMLQVKYALKDWSDVRIRLLNTAQQAISDSEYKHQRPGNFLKSISIKNVPKGRYLLIIEANQKVIEQYEVLNGA